VPLFLTCTEFEYFFCQLTNDDGHGGCHGATRLWIKEQYTYAFLDTYFMFDNGYIIIMKEGDTILIHTPRYCSTDLDLMKRS